MLKPGAVFVKMENAGSFRLPPQATVVHAGIAETLKKGDYIKFCVDAANGAREKFWVKFERLDPINETVDVVVDNDMVYTDFHGVACDQKLTIPVQFICAVMRNQ